MTADFWNSKPSELACASALAFALALGCRLGFAQAARDVRSHGGDGKASELREVCCNPHGEHGTLGCRTPRTADGSIFLDGLLLERSSEPSPWPDSSSSIPGCVSSWLASATTSTVSLVLIRAGLAPADRSPGGRAFAGAPGSCGVRRLRRAVPFPPLDAAVSMFRLARAAGCQRALHPSDTQICPIY